MIPNTNKEVFEVMRKKHLSVVFLISANLYLIFKQKGNQIFNCKRRYEFEDDFYGCAISKRIFKCAVS